VSATEEASPREPRPHDDHQLSDLGLPEQITACLFDLDGVLTQTAKIHAAAWKQTFDAFLAAYGRQVGKTFEPFDEVRDYELYVDGKPRPDGVRSFLAARGVELPEGTPDDPTTAQTVQGVGNAKNKAFNEVLEDQGLEPFQGSVSYVHAVQTAGLRRAVVTSSANCAAVLRATGMDGLFDTTIDGNDLARLHLLGKPAPDTYLAAARALEVGPGEAAVFEDALAGVEAGRAGKFGWVVGVDRLGQAAALRENGADVVVDDLADLLSGNRRPESGSAR
jgi:beta-phosphoglucomutase family hydrolase